MIVSQKHGFIFLHNPKAAGTAFRKAIEKYHDFPRRFWGYPHNEYMGGLQLDLAHMRLWEMPALAPNLFAELGKYRKLVFVRCPFRRFVSACHQHFAVFKPQVGLAKLPAVEQRRIIVDFMQSDLTLAKTMSDFRYVHFSQQSWYVYLGIGKRVTDFVLPMRDINASFDVLQIPAEPVGRWNARAAKAEDVMCSDIEVFVRRFYARDFAMLSQLNLTDVIDIIPS